MLLRLDQAMGSAAEVLTSLVPPEVPRSELRFAEPLSDPEDLKRVIAGCFKSVSRRGPVNPLPVREPIPPEDCI